MQDNKEDAAEDKMAEGTESAQESSKEKDQESPLKETSKEGEGGSEPDSSDSQKEESKEGEPEKEQGQKETASETQAQEDEPAEEDDKKSRFGRKKKEKDKKDQQIEDLTDRVQRQMAEFDNYRKRTEKEKSAMFEMGEKSVLEKILPTVDNLERGLSGLNDEQKEDAFAQGMEKVYRQLVTALDGLGVKPIEALGQPFDPNFHNAVQHVEDEDAGENIVVEEFQKGYMYRDSVLRHSMVKVAN